MSIFKTRDSRHGVRINTMENIRNDLVFVLNMPILLRDAWTWTMKKNVILAKKVNDSWICVFYNIVSIIHFNIAWKLSFNHGSKIKL